jgi:uncharacterized membrane protein YbhN (UPF0104 family)
VTATPVRIRSDKSVAPPGRSHAAWWMWVRLLGTAAVLALLVWLLGSGPFVDGVRLVTRRSLAAGAGIAVLTTICAAWRWSLVSRGLGVVLPLRTAVAAYYRSQFLNTVLPGGVLGDLHRAVRQGHDTGTSVAASGRSPENAPPGRSFR